MTRKSTPTSQPQRPRRKLRLVSTLLAWSGALTLLAAVCLSLIAVPPLSLEGYLDEKLPEAPSQHVPELAANQPCFVCHGNLKEDKLVLRHAESEIGCVDCHGPSVAHRNDEDNITPPDKMYPVERIDAMCQECHETHDVAPRKLIERLHARKLTNKKPAEITCTSCHFEHRLAHRTVRWDKKTKKLLGRPVKPAGNLPVTKQGTQPSR